MCVCVCVYCLKELVCVEQHRWGGVYAFVCVCVIVCVCVCVRGGVRGEGGVSIRVRAVS